jgi:hypothetical protein
MSHIMQWRIPDLISSTIIAKVQDALLVGTVKGTGRITKAIGKGRAPAPHQ